ncbi:cellular nucleic acid-binding protein, partial [Trifolium medium]|nr:cellular nucleic acid-binding protein [Trifolium medium]
MSSREVERSLREHGDMFVMFASLTLEDKFEIGVLPVVCEFSDVFPSDVSDVPPEREVEFVIDVVP